MCVSMISVIYFSPVVIEVPHFASLRGREREISILRSDNGQNWREHTMQATEEAVQEAINGSFQGEGKETDKNESGEVVVEPHGGGRGEGDRPEAG